MTDVEGETQPNRSVRARRTGPPRKTGPTAAEGRRSGQHRRTLQSPSQNEGTAEVLIT